MKHQGLETRIGKIQEWLRGKRVPTKVIFIVTGILATVWFLIRVIPKPSRAGYPCMKVAFPVMATFIMWLVSFTGAFVAFKSVGKFFRKSKYLAALAIFAAGLVSSAILINTGTISLKAKNLTDNSKVAVFHEPNQPMGIGEGIFPGRVIWDWNADATDETCENTGSDQYVFDSNTDQSTVDAMLTESIIALGGGANASESWDAIFKYFNAKKGRGSVAYANDETIFIKINEGTSSWNANNDLGRKDRSQIAETSPQVTLGILKQLIEEAGVPQQNIWVADPKSHIYKQDYEKFYAAYPDVNYGDRDKTDWSGESRIMLTENPTPSVYYSDKGTQMPDAINETYYEQMVNADYMINIAALKAHARAGITLTAKNHFGSHNRGDSFHLHPGLVAPENDKVERADYGMYRVQVDLMGSSVLGGNTLLFLVDGLWGGVEATEYPVKWTMAPFNNDWPNSLFMSLDQVALESVCFDFLRNEASVGSALWKNRPNFAQGVDDYLHQAADSENWPDGISYDPDNSGKAIESLGTHEHWNNPNQKQYSRNLGRKEGIELYSIPSDQVVSESFTAKQASTLPAVDGIGDDDCWKTVEWNQIDQLWIPWGPNTIPFEDFNGKFKVLWSETTNLLYILAETTDDVFVDGYTYPQTNYPDYDILEVFLDEDHSGGPHVFDSGDENAENAFSYHIAIDQPEDGGTTATAHVCDIAGTSWNDRTTPNYFSHFPEFTVKRNGNKLTWEFALQVHNDSYDASDPDASLAALTEGKVLGLSLAYCDNDDPNENPPSRDNFFGSVKVSEAAYNDHWQLADDYGELTLSASGSAINHAPQITASIPDYKFAQKNTEYDIVNDLRTCFTDEDGDVLAFQVSKSNEFLSLTIDGNKLSGTVLSGYSGSTTVTVIASDDMLYNTTIQFQVTAENKAPELIAEIADYIVDNVGKTETVIYNLKTIFSDPDEDYLGFTAESSDPELTVTVLGLNLRITSSNDFVGPATVTVTANDGELSAETDFKVISTVGIALAEISRSINLYPNPVNDNLHVDFYSDFNGEVLLRIISINGQLCKSIYYNKQQQNFNHDINVNNLSKGSYLLEIHNAGALVNRMFIKQ